MMSQGYLAEYARQAIWCSPFEDEQAILALKRITPINGAIKEVKIFQDYYTLPDSQDDFHVFMIGGNHPLQLSFPYTQGEWIKLSDWCMLNQLVAYLYTTRGILFPLSQTFVLREEDDNFLIAIRISPTLPDMNKEEVFLHLYHNEFWTRDIKQKLNEQVVCLGAEFRYGAEMELVQSKLIEYKNKGMVRHVFFNGKMVEDYRHSTQRDDVLEFMVDGSIYTETFFKVSELPHFHSELDKAKKFLLHLPKNHSKQNQIYYRDDISLFLVKIPEVNQDNFTEAKIVDSRYYHRNREDSLRMLTHQDYSIPVDYVSSLIRDTDETLNLEQWYIRFVVRRSGINRYLVNEKHHIRELYRLNDTQIVNAMVGTAATIPVWQAANLETSTYTYLMRAYRHEVTDEKTIEALGYVGAARVLANPCISVTRNPNRDYFKLPVGLVSLSTIYEYDRQGRLLGFHKHNGSVVYFPKNKETIYVEAIAGLGSPTPEIYVNPPKTLPLFPASEYRAYVSELDKRGAVTEFRDVTLEKAYYHRTEDNQALIDFNKDKEVFVLMGDGHWLAYETEIDDTDGVLDFSLFHNNNRLPVMIPYGKIDVWLNGYALVEGIDFYVNYPLICIVSKNYIDRTQPKQKLTIRATGFCDKNLNRFVPRETGFVTYGKISCDNHYDLHDENISRITVAGATIDPRLLEFDHANGEADVRPFKDGLPFAVEDYYIPLRGFRGINLYKAFEEDKEVGKAISDYLTKLLPSPKRQPNPDIPKEYQVYSPVLSKMIKDIQTGRLTIGRLNAKDRMAVERIVERYKRYLAVDPAYVGFDFDYVTVHPLSGENMVTLEYREYEFLAAVNKIYFEDVVNLNHWVKVSAKTKGNNE